jgi:transposase-like protein
MNEALDMVKAYIPRFDTDEKLELYGIIKAAIDADGQRAYDKDGKPDTCPYCGCNKMHKRGRDHTGAQRWLCGGCARAFTGRTNSIVAQSKLPIQTWYEYIRCMVDALSLRESARRVGVGLRTSFFMRHRILECLSSYLPVFVVDKGCTAEIDETHMRVSYSGNWDKNPGFKMPRDMRKRGRDHVSRGISKDQICIVCGINDEGDIFLEIAGTGVLSKDEAKKCLADKICEGAKVATDLRRAYAVPLEDAGVKEHIKVDSRDRSTGVINMVNALHSRLKDFMARFHGVSARRLLNYLLWFKWRELAKRTDAASLMAHQVSKGRYRTTWRGYKYSPWPEGTVGSYAV